MPFVPIPNVASLEAIWEVGSETMENTFHYHFGAAITEAELRGLQNTYSTWAGAHVSLFHSSCALVKLISRDLSSSGGLRVEGNVIPPVTGSDSTGIMPNNVTFSVKRQTGLAGRANRGRVYVIGIPQDFIDAGRQRIAATSANAYVAAYDVLMNAQFSDNAADEVIAHRSLGTFTHVTGYAYSDLFLDSQRRRLPGHNRHH